MAPRCDIIPFDRSPGHIGFHLRVAISRRCATEGESKVGPTRISRGVRLCAALSGKTDMTKVILHARK
jgi:hypothetical protein